jgi:beta-lactamase class C
LSVATEATLPPKLQAFIKKFESQQKELQGGAIAILHNGQVVYKSTFGNQKGNTGPITSHTLFPLASVSKPVSATAVALLVDSGKLDFDDKINISDHKNPVSLKNILSHTTGYQFSGNSHIEQGKSRRELLDLLKIQKPKCNPGECYSYSNATFSLVEEILNTQNLDLQSAIEKLRFALKSDEIQVMPINANMKIAYPHARDKTKKTQSLKSLPFPPYYPKATPAAAGVFASLDGMIEIFKLSFGYRPDLISQKTLDYIHTPVISNRDIDKWQVKWPYDKNEIESYYGLGWRILKAKDHPGKDLIFHSGYIAGIVSFMGFIPSEQIGVIILINEDSRVAGQTGINFWSQFLSSKTIT